MSTGSAGELPPLHERASRQLARLVNARRDLLVLGVAGTEASLTRFEADLAVRIRPRREMLRVDLAPEETAVWSAVLERAKAAGDPERLLLSVRLVGGVEGRAAQLNLGREVRQAHALAVIFWVEDEDQLDRLRNLAPDLWAHRSYVVLLLEWEDHAKEPPREVPPSIAALIAQKQAEIAAQDPNDPTRLVNQSELMRLCFHAGALDRARELLGEVTHTISRFRPLDAQVEDVLGADVPRMTVQFLMHDGQTDAGLSLAERLLRDLRARSMRISIGLLLSAYAGALRARCRHREAIVALQEAAGGEQYAGEDSSEKYLNACIDWIEVAKECLRLGSLRHVEQTIDDVSRNLKLVHATRDVLRSQMSEIETNIVGLRAMRGWMSGEPYDAVVEAARSQVRAEQTGIPWLVRLYDERAHQIGVEFGAPSPSADRSAHRETLSLLDVRTFEWRAWPRPWVIRDASSLPEAFSRELRRNLRDVDRQGPPDKKIRLREVLAFVAWCQRHYDDARRYLRWLLHAAGPPWGPIRRAKIHAAMARVELSDRRPHDALVHVADGEREHAHEPEAYRSRFVARDLAVARAEALLQLDRVPEARAVLVAARAALRAEGLILPSFDVEHLLLTLPLEGDSAERRRAAEEVWAATQQSGALWFEARALVDLAWIRRQSGENVDGLLDEAAWVFERFDDDEQLARAKSLYSRPLASTRAPA